MTVRHNDDNDDDDNDDDDDDEKLKAHEEQLITAEMHNSPGAANSHAQTIHLLLLLRVEALHLLISLLAVHAQLAVCQTQ